MRVLFLLLTLFFQFNMAVLAETTVFENVENIDLNLKEHEMAVTFLGAEGGGATIIQGYNGQNALAYSGGDLFELENWLSLYKVKEINKLIITKEASLSSNLDVLIEKYHIKELIAPAKLALWLNKNVNSVNQLVLTSWQEGTKMILLPEITVEVQFAGTEKEEGLDFTLNFFKHRLFLMNSISDRAEQTLLSKKLGVVNVFKVPGNAKDDTISEQLIEHINPQVSILYAHQEHPEGEALVDDLYKAWSEVYFTKKGVTVTIKFTEANYEVFTIPPVGNK